MTAGSPAPAAMAPARPGSSAVCSEVNTNNGTRARTRAASSAPTTAGSPGESSLALITATLMMTWASSMVAMSMPSRPLVAFQGSAGPRRRSASSGPSVSAADSSGATVRMNPNATAEWLPAAPSAPARVARPAPSMASWPPYAPNLAWPASVPRPIVVTAMATHALASSATIVVSPPNSRRASGPAATASGTKITVRTTADSAQKRRTTGMTPSPTAVRAATSRMSSCSTGRNTPSPSRKTSDQSTDTAAMPPAGRLCPATARWTYMPAPSTISPAPTDSVPWGSRSRAARLVRLAPWAPAVSGISTLEPLVDLLAGEPEIGQRVAVRWPGGAGALLAQPAHGGRGAVGQRQPEVPVHRLDRADRVGDELVVGHVVELGRITGRPHRRKAVKTSRPRFQLVPADHLAAERRRPAGRHLRGQAADGRDRLPRRPVRLDHQRVRVHPQQRVQREQVAWVLQHPAPANVWQADQLQVAPVPAVGGGPVLAGQPGGVAGQVREALVGDRPHRLPQQLPALLHLVGGHVVHRHELGIGHMVPFEARLDVLEHRVAGPGFPGRPWLRRLGEPHLQALIGRIGGEQPVQGGRAGAGEPGDKDRPLDADVRVLGMLGPGRLAEQPGDQRTAQQRPGHPGSLGGQARVAGVGVQQDREAVAVVAGAEIRQPGDLGGRRVQVIGGPDPVALTHRTPRQSMVVLAAVDVQALTGDGAGHGRGQEHHRVGDLVRLRQR